MRKYSSLLVETMVKDGIICMTLIGRSLIGLLTSASIIMMTVHALMAPYGACIWGAKGDLSAVSQSVPFALEING